MPPPAVRLDLFVVRSTTSPHQLVVVVVKISLAVEVQPPTSARTRGGNDASHGRGLGHVTPPVELRLADRVSARRGGGPEEASAARPHSRPRQKARRARLSGLAEISLSMLDLTVTARSELLPHYARALPQTPFTDQSNTVTVARAKRPPHDRARCAALLEFNKNALVTHVA